MCGIFGIYNSNLAKTIAKRILIAQESRGKDATGIAWINDNQIHIYKRAVEPKEFIAELDNLEISNIAIGHNRNATTNIPEKDKDTEAHPFIAESKEFAIVHNGTFRNYEYLRYLLKCYGHRFSSGVDSEVFVHLLEDLLNRFDRDEAITRFRYLSSGNILILFKDGALYGIPDKAFNVLRADNSVIIASEYEALLQLLDLFDKAELYRPEEDSILKISNNRLVLIGDWNKDIVKYNDFEAYDRKKCDYCDEWGFVQKFNNHDRCFKCYRENRTEPKQKANVVTVKEAVAICSKCGKEVSVDEIVYLEDEKKFVCYDCLGEKKCYRNCRLPFYM